MPLNFAGIESTPETFKGARFVLLPVPYDSTTSYQPGARWGPQAILSASNYLELYDEVLGEETYRKGIYTAPPLECDMRGPEHMVAAVSQAIIPILATGKIPITLGGEHTITIGAVQAVRAHYGTVTVLHLDAHADLRDTYERSPYSHACVARRVWESGPIVEVGVRSLSKEEADFIQAHHIPVFSAAYVAEHPQWIENILAQLSGPIYLSLDLDCLDPSIMPATGTPEPGGLMYRDVMRLVAALTQKFTIVAADVVELSPLPGMIAPDFTAAKLIYRLMGYL